MTRFARRVPMLMAAPLLWAIGSPVVHAQGDASEDSSTAPTPTAISPQTAVVPEATVAPETAVPVTGRVVVATTIDGAKVFVDGSEVGSAPIAPLELSAGKHTIKVVAPDLNPFEGDVLVVAGASTRINADVDQTALLPAVAAKREAESDTPWYLRWYVLAGVGAVVLGTVIIAVAASSSSSDDSNEAVLIPEIQ